MAEVKEDSVKTEDGVVILDAGSQFAWIIERRIRELCVKGDFLPLTTPASCLKQRKYKAIIITGGPKSVDDPTVPVNDPDIFHLGVPVLGICFGLQLMNATFRGTLEMKEVREDGQFKIKVDTSCALFNGLEEEQLVLFTHGESIGDLAPGFKAVAHSGDHIIAGISNEEKKLYGVQFHPEIDLSINGQEMMKNFLQMSGCKFTYTSASREMGCIDYIKQSVGDKKILMLLSGGVDSTVCAALLHKALSDDQVIALHIDNGFMRKHESEEVEASLKKIGLNVKVVNAADKFYSGRTYVTDSKEGQKRETNTLSKTVDPEVKRKIIGDAFIKVAYEVLEQLGLRLEDVYLAQGTCLPDLIQSASILASGFTSVIKTHHNDTHLVRELRKQGRVIEPLKAFHKDEVRSMGIDLGVPSELINRHPFPGPGLAIRVVCAEQPYLCQDFEETSEIVKRIVNFSQASKTPHTLLDKIIRTTSEDERLFLEKFSTAFAVTATLLPIKSAGVQGDCRSYKYVVGLSSSFEANQLDWCNLIHLAKIIPRICHNINRIVYIFGDVVKYPVTDVTPTYLTEGVVSALRHADYVANKVLHDNKCTEDLSQMPIVMVPLHFDREPSLNQLSYQRSIVIRTLITRDFMAGIVAEPDKHLPLKVIEDMVSSIKEDPGISRVMYDLSGKPPGSTEWE